MEMIIAIAVVVTNVSSEPIKQLSVGKIDENILRSVRCLLSRLWLIWCEGGGAGGGELRPHRRLREAVCVVDGRSSFAARLPCLLL